MKKKPDCDHENNDSSANPAKRYRVNESFYRLRHISQFSRETTNSSHSHSGGLHEVFRDVSNLSPTREGDQGLQPPNPVNASTAKQTPIKRGKRQCLYNGLTSTKNIAAILSLFYLNLVF